MAQRRLLSAAQAPEPLSRLSAEISKYFVCPAAFAPLPIVADDLRAAKALSRRLDS
jgi:hypothetical protein